jgi:hypothetical protein
LIFGHEVVGDSTHALNKHLAAALGKLHLVGAS